MNAAVQVKPWRAEEFEGRLVALEQQVAELMELKTANPRRVFMTDVVKWRLAGALPDLQRRHRGYVTAKIVAEHFGFPLDSTRIGIRKAVAAGKVRLERVRGRHDWMATLHLTYQAQAVVCGSRSYRYGQPDPQRRPLPV